MLMNLINEGKVGRDFVCSMCRGADAHVVTRDQAREVLDEAGFRRFEELKRKQEARATKTHL